MRFKSLTSGIFLNLFILLILAIGLTNFVIFRIVENQLIDHRLHETEQWLLSVSPDYSHNPGNAETSPGNVYLLRTVEGYPSLAGHALNSTNESLIDLSHQVIRTGNPAHRFIGRAWGVVGMQSRYLAVAVPSAYAPVVAMAVVDLDPLFQNLRDSHRIILFYLAVNFVILLLLFTFLLTRLVTRPIQRLIKLTDSYHSPEHFGFFSVRQDGEFGQLSSALNRMLKRIERDRWMLQQSLRSIEEANFELKRAQQEVVRAEKLASTGRLSAGIAHEIGNPIGIVLGYLSLLKNRSLPPETAADFISRAESEINRVNTIIRQLLDFSRVAPETSNTLSFHDLLRDTGEILSKQPLFSNIRIVYALAAPNDTVLADHNQLRQVIVNLMINAADSIGMGNAEDDDGRIELITRSKASSDHDRNAGLFELQVRDNGCGIPGDAIEKIFDPFFTTKEPGKGTGLGLSVSYMIIERFGGTIEARSNVGPGTTMVVCLPLAKDKREE